MMTKGDEAESEVNWEDQKQICRFSQLNNQYHDLGDRIEFLQKLIQQENDSLLPIDDFELLGEEGESVRCLVGEIFSHVTVDEAKERVNRKLREDTAQLHEYTSKRDEVQREMASLKGTLYAKFKNTINLEED
ncbi:putative prefoldin subunit 4 [Blattamonas nauphoetae]|uniref:Prefoldin subunit 4 n=1 Tax=Blattamonas nauphoetae TaxID=2049346 RepID=A0ABQ9Y6C9_9EUKA|nr:putative prefoldin subunit 4 [Blattamonas nauphoetae]